MRSDDEPGDRFADLGSGTRAGDRLAELDDRGEGQPEPPPRRSGRYAWVVGVAAVIAIAAAGLNSLPNEQRGTSGPPVGEPIPKFAAPGLEQGPAFDANVNQSASDPAPGETPACEVDVEGAIRSCDYTSKPLVLTFIAPTAECARFVDRVERLREELPGVNFLTVISGPPDRSAELARDSGWRQPVAFDRSGAVLTRYRLFTCPNVVLARSGGVAEATQTQAQALSDAQLEAAIRRLGTS